MVLAGKQLSLAKFRFFLVGGLLLLAGISLLPHFIDTALLNRGAVACGRELISQDNNYFLTDLKPVENVSTICQNALTDFQEVASNSQGAALWSGRVQLARRNFAQAITGLEKANRLTPANDLSRFFSGISYLTEGQTDQAKFEWQAMSAPTYALVMLGDRLAAKEQCNAALNYYQLAIEANTTGQERAHLGLAQCLYTLQRFPQAVDEYKAAFAAGLKNAEIADKLGKLLVTLKRLQEALPYLEQAVNWHRYVYYLLDLAETYGATGDLQKAEVWFDEAEKLAPGSPIVPYARGNYYFSQQQYANAIASYERVIALDPKGPVYYYTNLGRAYLAANQPSKALPVLQEAQRREPNDPAIKQLLEAANK
jgi:tetratricopeptide (TPR) repeat protein